MTVAEEATPFVPRAVRQRYVQPLVLSIAASVLAELAIFVIWGVLLYPDGNLLIKFVWTVVFCGVGMGSTVGVLILLFVVDRLDGTPAIVACATLSALVLGLGCNVLCLTLDSHYFHYFGGAENPIVFIANGVIAATLGGGAIGWLLFSDRGRALLERKGEAG